MSDPAESDDQALLERALSGDESAPAAPFDGYRDRLREYPPAVDPARFWDELEIRWLRSEAEAVVLYGETFSDDPFAEGLTVADVVNLYTVDAKNQDLLRRATQSSMLPESWKDYFRKHLREPDA
jgi:hypothetical protein